MIAQELIDRLAEHRTLGTVPRTELEWLVAHGSIQNLSPGDVLSMKGHPVSGLYIVLSGRLALFIDRGSGPNKFVEWHGGDITGMLPYSRMVSPPGDVRALEPAEVLAIPRDLLEEMTRACFEVTSILVHIMIDRARLFTTGELENEKMISLGKLSAGLAHELNNPASAIERCAAMLEDRVEESEEGIRNLAAATLSEAQIATVDLVRASCMTSQNQKVRSSLEQADREEVLEGWLAGRGLDTASACLLADTEVTLDALNLLARTVERPALDAVVRWIASCCSVRSLAWQIQDCSMRISSLVNAVKGFTKMDQANVSEPVYLSPGLSDTVMVLNSKACGKSVVVTLELEPELPMVRAFAVELNQIWGILLDNALDAAANGGKVDVSATREDQHVIVRIIDDGVGIPEDIRSHIFDPFFTTKPMGYATGLGLDIARRLVHHNDASIDFESRPGRTEFRVRLPIAETDAVAVIQ